MSPTVLLIFAGIVVCANMIGGYLGEKLWGPTLARRYYRAVLGERSDLEERLQAVEKSHDMVVQLADKLTEFLNSVTKTGEAPSS